MVPPPQVTQWLDVNFPRPRVDPEWLEGCTEWVESDQNISPVTAFPEFMERVKWQLLESDLLDSMLPGTGLDAHVSTLSGNLSGQPVLVQINAITEIGASAFQLDQIRAAREERMLAGVGDEEGEEDGDVEVEGEGPMPKYPRNALRFQLTDGATSIEAMEYRRIPQLVLGNTPLGFKILLKGTRFQNGMAMLEPATIELLGGKQAELEANQLKDFKGALYERLRRPITPIPHGGGPMEENQNNAPAAAAAATARTPLRDISPPPMPALPPQHDDDVDMEPRRRLPTNTSLNDDPYPSDSDAANNRPIKALPSRQSRTTTGGVSNTSDDAQAQRRTPMAERATLVFPGSQTRITTSTYFNVNATASGSGSKQLPSREISAAIDGLDFNFEPTGRQLSRTLPSPSPARSYEPDVIGPFDFDFLDEMDQENQPPPQDKGKGRQAPSSAISSTKPSISSTVQDDSSDEYGMDDSNDFDPAFLEECAKIENAILKKDATHPSSSSSLIMSGSGSGASSSISSALKSSVAVTQQAQASHLPAHTATDNADVIVIDDSDDDMLEFENKENEPVATRHVRRRTDTASGTAITGPSRTAPSQSQLHRSQNTRKKTGQPVVLATNPDDIIDLSDSD